jgi:hypothetical protein
MYGLRRLLDIYLSLEGVLAKIGENGGNQILNGMYN